MAAPAPRTPHHPAAAAAAAAAGERITSALVVEIITHMKQ
jgi:hypothetical protein